MWLGGGGPVGRSPDLMGMGVVWRGARGDRNLLLCCQIWVGWALWVRMPCFLHVWLGGTGGGGGLEEGLGSLLSGVP